MDPKVFIVILNWNGYEVTKECLESLAKVTYGNFEVVLVDNGSADSSPEKLARDFPSVHIMRNETNLGFTGGNNVGIRYALEEGANYVLLLNNDTVVAPSFLSEMISVGERDQGTGILNPKIYYFDPPDRIWYAGGRFSPWRGFALHVGAQETERGRYDRLSEVTFITGCAFLVKASVVAKIGLLDEAFFYTCEDTDWSIRARQAGFKAMYVPSAVIWHKESLDTKRNAGKPFRDFYNVRNSILLARKHARPHQWPSFLFFLLCLLLYRTAGYLVRRELSRVRALFRGVRAGCGPLTTSVRYTE